MEEPRGRPGYARGGIVLVVAIGAVQLGRFLRLVFRTGHVTALL